MEMLAEMNIPDPKSMRGTIYAHLMKFPEATNDEMFRVLGITRDSPDYRCALNSAAQIRHWMFGRRNLRKSPDLRRFFKQDIFAIMEKENRHFTDEELCNRLGIARNHAQIRSIHLWSQLWREGKREIIRTVRRSRV